MCCGQITLSEIDEICPLAIPKQISTVSMHIPSLAKVYWYLLLKLWSGNENTDVSRADNSIKTDKFCPSAILNQIATISMHIPHLVKIHWYLPTLSSGHENMDVHGQITVKIYEICPLAIPNLIFTISMHIPSLVKIYWSLLKLSSGNETTDGRTYERRTDGRTQWQSTWYLNTL